MACTGDGSQECGGPERLSVYTNNGKGPAANPGVNGFAFQGCYTDSVSNRTLDHISGISGVTVSKCTAACKANGFLYSGVEYAGGMCLIPQFSLFIYLEVEYEKLIHHRVLLRQQHSEQCPACYFRL